MQQQQKQIIETVVERSIFDEVKEVIAVEQQLKTNLTDLDMVENWLNTKQLQYYQQQKFWATLIRLPWELKQLQQQQQWGYKIERCNVQCTPVMRIFTWNKFGIEKPVSFYLPSIFEKFIFENELQQWQHKIRVLNFVREGCLLVKVALTNEDMFERRFFNTFQEEKEQMLKTIIKQQMVKRLVERCHPQRSILEELEQVICQLELNQRPRTLRQLTDLLERKNFVLGNEFTQVIHMRPNTIFGDITFKVQKCNKTGFTQVKIYTKKDQQEQIIEKTIVRLPMWFNNIWTREEELEQILREHLRVQYLPLEGLVALRLPFVNKFVQEQKLREMINTPQQIYMINKTTPRRQWVERCLERSIFDELEQHFDWDEMDYVMRQEFRQCRTLRDIEQLERLLRKCNYIVRCRQQQQQPIWTNFFRLENILDEARREVTFKVKQDVATGCTIVKVYTTKPCFYNKEEQVLQTIIRLPTYFAKQEQWVQRHLRVQLTRDGLVLLRCPFIAEKLMQQWIINNTNNTWENTCDNNTWENIWRERDVELMQRSIFQELEYIWRQHQEPRTIEQLEQLLLERNNLCYTDNTTFDGCTKIQEWTQVIRHEFRPDELVTFKVKKSVDMDGECYIKVLTKKTNTIGETTKKCLIVRLPGKRQIKLNVHQTRVHITPEGVLLVRVPVFNKLNKWTNWCNDEDIIKQEWKQELLTEELKQIQRQIFNEVLPRFTTNDWSVVPTFYKLMKPSQYKHQIVLKVNLPTEVRAEQLVVRTRDQLVNFEIQQQQQRFMNNINSWCMPRQVAVEKLRVELVGQRLVHFIFPMVERSIFRRQQQIDCFYPTEKRQVAIATTTTTGMTPFYNDWEEQQRRRQIIRVVREL